ncbi:MAG: helix-turn-helix domain-containing protein, partial [Nocardioidaceae bacterium]
MASKRTAEGSTADAPPASVLLNGLRILETFTAEQPLLGVNEIARRVGQHKSTVSRILSSLESAEYVSRDDDSGRFRLGL